MIKQAYANMFPTELSADERTAVARFSTVITKLAVLGGDVSDFVKQAFAEVPVPVLADLTALAQVFVDHGTDLEKRAFSPLLSGLQANLAALPMKELQKLREAESTRVTALQDSLKSILKTHPQLAGDETSLAEHFDVMSRFAPDVASSPVLAGNILSQLHKLGPGALTHQMVAELRKIQEGLDAERQNRVKQTIEAISPFTRLQA